MLFPARTPNLRARAGTGGANGGHGVRPFGRERCYGGGAWRGAAIAAALLGLLLIVAFRGPLGGRLFYLRDISQNHYPVRHLVAERLGAGELPLWDPYHGGGTPLLANPDHLVLHPITALFFVLPFDAAFTASILLQYALLAWGGYLLGRALPVRREAAVLMGAILAFSGPAASLASLQNVLSGFAWVPIGLWAWLRGLEPGGRWRLSIAAACAAVILSTGEPASILAFLLLAGVLGTTRGAPSADGRFAGVLCLQALGAVRAAGLLIAAAQILPASELLAEAARAGGFTAADGMKWSLEPVRLAELLLPAVFGDPTRLSPESWWGGWLFEGRYPFLMSIYVGAIPCLLAAMSLLPHGEDGRRRRALAVAALLALLLSLGRHAALYRWLFGALPPVRQVRYPERFLLTALVALAILAAIGLDRLLGGRSPGRRRGIALLAAAAGAGFVLTTVLASSPSLADRFLAGCAAVPEAFLASDGGAVLRGGLLRAALWLFAEAALLAAGAVLAARAGSEAGVAAAGWSIAAACGLSLVLATAPTLSTAAPGWLKAPSRLRGIVGHGPGAPRLHHDPRPDSLSVWGTTDELAWGFRFDRFAYELASGHVDRVPTILDPATDRMDLAPQAALGRRLPGLPLEDRLRILSIARAGFLLTYETLVHPGLEAGPVLDDLSRPPLRLYRVRSILPRARFVARAVPPAHPGDLARSLADPGFDPRREALIDGAAAAVRSPGEGTAEILEDSPERVRLRVETPAPGFLVLSDAYDPGWRARLDGAPVQVTRADGLFRAVAVPAGRHEVVMVYAPPSVRRGLMVSLLAVAGTIVWGGVALRRGR